LAPYAYYLALGDSLAAGYQPEASTGAGYLSGRGYADDLAGELRAGDRRLDYVNLGCPGETTTSMLHGGCPWPEAYATQMGAATGFLTAHRGAHVLVTLDIGANGIDSCATRTGVDPVCLATGTAAARADIPVILRDLRAAAGPAATIVGMTYYDPFLSYWLTGVSGERIAASSVALVDGFNSALKADYAAVGVRIADVASAFGTNSPLPLVSYRGTLVPLNVDRVCASTWMCDAPPTGPNVHANDAGYRLIYQAVRSALPR
jgi:lysophospholipase L1-like esterase